MYLQYVMTKILGAMLTHDNITWSSFVTMGHIKWVPEDILMSYLPMSHIAALLFDNYMPYSIGVTVVHADSEALRGTLVMPSLDVKYLHEIFACWVKKFHCNFCTVI